ncbi:MAG: ATP-binding protein [Gemmatimonadaceae bacterium]
MTGVLAAGLATSLVLTYGALTQSEEGRVRKRLTSAAQEVTESAVTSMADRLARVRAMAGDGAIRQALADVRTGGDTAFSLPDARRTLARLQSSPTDTLPIELWSADGRRLALLGSDVGASRIGSPPRGQAHPVPREGLELLGAIDSAAFGEMYAVAERVYFWIVAPVTDGGQPGGYIAQQRRVGGPSTATQRLRGLMDEEVAMYIRNQTGSFWTTAPGAPVPAPARRDSIGANLFDVRPGVGRLTTVELPITGTPWVMVLEAPVSAVEARAQTTVRTLALISLLLTALGAVASWVISRRITAPLASLTTAAEAIARGEYARRADHVGGDEVGRLAVSFNQMAGEVDSARQALERQVAEARSAAEELALANRQLQHTMGEAEHARRDAELAREEAERANRAKGDFLAVMSHELRTPLNAIGGYTQLLEMGVHGPVTEAQRDALARIERSQAHLLRLINDVLNFAKVDAGQVQYAIADVPLDEALTSLEALVAPQLRAKRLAYTYQPCDSRITVRADPEKLQQIVLNLLSNAIKYTPEGGSVATGCEVGAASVCVTVRDTGLGIPPDRMAAIFDPFVQVDRALHRPNDGVGLGLAISRDLARGMSGELTAESVVGGGSVFTLTLPRPEAEPVVSAGVAEDHSPRVSAEA